ncbi:MAG: NYN domain-containing protein [Pseudolysinimonas sp.]
MAESGDLTEARVAVYIDFDNVVISRYDQLHGRNAWRNDEARSNDPKLASKLDVARVDIGAILDYASSFGTVALSRAYADWSVPANAAYRRQLVDRAIDLTQLFPASSTKNGADIRLAVDVIDDLFRLPDITHVVVVAGDSDYIPLVQRCKRMGRIVIGIGVSGSTSQALMSALDEFESYDAIQREEAVAVIAAPIAASKTRAEPTGVDPVSETVAPPAMTTDDASRLLVRAIGLSSAKAGVDEWLNASALKSQIKRLNPSFNEKTLGYKSFMDFVTASTDLVEVKEEGQQRYVRMREEKPADSPAKRAPRRAKSAPTSS